MFDIIKSNPVLWIIIFLAIVAPSVLFGAVQVVLFLILGFIVLLFILSLLFRVRIRAMRSHMETEMRDAANPSAQQQEEGDVKIYTTTSQHEKRVKKDVGDYVDFEEVDK